VELLRKRGAQSGWAHLVWISEKDRGQTDALNKGFRRSTGDILAYLCADDLYEPTIFSFVRDYFTQYPNVEMIYGGCTFLEENGKPLRTKKAVPFSREELLRRNIIWQPTVFFRRSVWEKVGEFNESLQYAMDYEYWLRAARVCNIAAVDRKLARYRWQMESKTISREREQLSEGYRVATQFGGGGIYSWYLFKIYYPNTSRMKRWLFAHASDTNVFK
jgi:glycosyltransferase involved in cell wall biosynthesis